MKLTRLNNASFFLLLLLIFLCSHAKIIAQETGPELTDINFSGNESISSAVLETVINSSESPGWFSKALNFIGLGDEPVYFDSTIIQLDLNALRNYYFDSGFFESTFDYDYNISEDREDAELTFFIEEGDRSRINSLSLIGIDELQTVFQEGIRDLVETDTTDFYEKLVLTKLQSDISSYLREKGMMLAETDVPDVLIDTVANSVDITINVFPGKRYTINEIRVEKAGEGKDLVENELIEDIVDVNVGDRYNAAKLRSSQARLYRTNLFNYALVSGIIADTSGNTVPLLVSTNVGLLNEFTPEVILNNQDNAFNLGLSFGFTRKNFLGSARRFNVTTSAASQNIIEFLSKPIISDTSVTGYADLRFKLDQPFIFGQPIYTSLESYVTLQKRKKEFNETIIGGRLSFNFELPEKVYINSLSTYFNFEHSRFLYADQYLLDAIYEFLLREDYPDRDPTKEEEEILREAADSLAEFFGEEDFKTNNSLIGVQLAANKTNSFLYPTEGYSIGIVLENSNLFPYLVSKIFKYDMEEPQYYRLRINTTGFIPLSPQNTSTLGAKLTVGNIDAYKGSKFRVPFNQRYASGGSNSVRGWGARELVSGKADIDFADLNPSTIDRLLLLGEPLGGYFLFEGSFEWRQKFLNNLGSAIFVDYGNTLFAPEDFKFNKLAVAIGFGLRYYSEIVPLRLDFGFKFYDPENPVSFFRRQDILGEAFQFHIGIGEAF